MNLNFKTLSHEKFTIEIHDPSLITVLQLKSLIETQKGHPVESQKLIYSGKILDNSKLIQDYNIKEENFIVFMLSKKTASTSATTKQTNPEKPVEKPQEQDVPENNTKETNQVISETSNTSDSQTLLSGTSYEQAVLRLMELGFERPQVTRAMKASFNNPDRAAEYLLTNSIPETDFESTEVESTGATAASDNTSLTGTQNAENLFTAAAQQAANRQNNSSSTETGNLPDDFSSLRNSPIFQQLRTAVQHNPALLQPILEQIASTNPSAFNVINNNPDAFIRLFSDESQDENNEETNPENLLPGINHESPVDENTQYIRITQEEKEAIDRLVELGFDRNTVTQAYFACEKNEELTANYLFEHGHEDE